MLVQCLVRHRAAAVPDPRADQHLSRFAHQPGDLIATGTPAGVGAARKPPLWLQPGDRIEVEIGGIGVLANTVAP